MLTRLRRPFAAAGSFLMLLIAPLLVVFALLEEGGGDGDEDEEEEDEEELGPKGKKALADERKARREATRQLEAERKAREKAEKEANDLRAAGASDQEKELEKARAEAREEAKREADAAADEKVAKANRRVVASEARAAAIAAGVKADRVGAFLKHVELDDISVDDDGAVDEKALKAAVDDGLDEVPEFKAEEGSGGGSSSGSGGPAQGARRGSDTPMKEKVDGRLEKIKATTGIS